MLWILTYNYAQLLIKKRKGVVRIKMTNKKNEWNKMKKREV